MRTNQKALIDIYILDILGDYASKEKPITQAKVQELLAEQPYEISISRNSLAEYICALRNAGYILGKRGIYRKGYFDDHELRLLIDGVLFGQHIPKEAAEELIKKLKNMSKHGLKNRIRHVHYLEALNRTENRNLYDMIDSIDEAIQTGCQIKVDRCRYNELGQRIRLKDEYILHPYYLVTDKSQYYLICLMEKNGRLITELLNLRVDRFLSVEILKNKQARSIREIPKYKDGFQLDEYMKEHVYMVSGKTVHIVMKVKKSHIGDFIDWYGRDYKIVESDDREVTIRFEGNDNALKYWALQYNSIATVLEPQSLVNMIREETERLVQKYS